MNFSQVAARRGGASQVACGNVPHARELRCRGLPRAALSSYIESSHRSEARGARGRCSGKQRLSASATVAVVAVAAEPEVLSCTQYLGDAGIWVIVSKGDGDYQVEVIADQPRPRLVMHWAVNEWELPPESAWPAGTVKAGEGAVQSPFEFGQLVTLTFPESLCPSKLVFVLKDGDQWINNRGGDFTADLKPTGVEEIRAYTPPAPPLPQPELLSHAHYDAAGVSVVVDRNNGVYQVEIAADKPRPDLVLHWAVNDWQLPPEAAWPAGTVQAGEGAVQTPFLRGEYVTLTFPESVCPSKLVFVLKEKDKWTKNSGQDFTAELKPKSAETEGLEILSYHHSESGISTVVGKATGSYLVEVVADHPRPELVMHWAVDGWQLPPKAAWPAGTVQAGEGAVQTAFQGGQSIKMLFPEPVCPSKLVFVLKEGEQWINNEGGDFTADLKPKPKTAAAPATPSAEPEVISCTNYDAGILVVVGRVDGAYMMVVMSDRPRPDMVLHWAVDDWRLPQKRVWPAGSVQAGDAAVQTPFRQGGQSVALAFPEGMCPSKVVFVLKEGEQWVTDKGQDFTAELKPAHAKDGAEVLSTNHHDAGIWAANKMLSGQRDSKQPNLVAH